MSRFYLLFIVSAFAQCFHPNTEKSCRDIVGKSIVQSSVVDGRKSNTPIGGIEVTEESTDSVLFERIISDVKKAFPRISNANKHELIIKIARAMKGIPYVAQTLEVGKHETLVINLRQLDCTTYVENVVAMYLCMKNQDCRYSVFKDNIRRLRYASGNVSYPNRLHYFSQWITENTKNGVVREMHTPNPPFTALQRLSINFMTTHSELYPRLKNDTSAIDDIRQSEKKLTGMTFPYIPKAEIANTHLFRQTIHDGDIIAITTRKSGLDTSHIGIAVWHKDGLHMLNASQIHKKVVEEPMLLREYMQKHPSQVGIRIVRILY